MFSIKNRAVIGFVLLIAMTGLVLISPITLFIVIAGFVVVIANSFIKTHFEFDYKYVFSFFGQLVGLIFIVASFVSVFILLSGLLTQ